MYRAFLGIILVGIAGCSKQPEAAGGRGGPVPVNVGEAVRKDVPFNVRAFGNVEAVATVGIKAQVGGELTEVNFAEGQEVKKGELLFTIQPKLYATQLAQAEANLARDRAQAAMARRDAVRQEQLGNDGVSSLKALDLARSQAESFEATVKADEALREIATVQLGYTTIKAPITGRTGALNAHAGNLIKANADDTMVTINQVSPIYVAFAIDQSYLGEIRDALKTRKLMVSALDRKDGRALAEGECTFVDNAVDMTTGNITLKATFTNDDRVLWPGGDVDAILHLRVDADRTVVPSSAVTIGQRGPQIFVVNAGGSAELRPVTVERTLGQESLIEKGVAPGEKVVVLGQSRLVPGSKVTILPAVVAPPDEHPDSPSAQPTKTGPVAAPPAVPSAKPGAA